MLSCSSSFLCFCGSGLGWKMYAKWGMTQAGKITQLIMFCVQAPNITMPSNGSRLPGFTPYSRPAARRSCVLYPFVLCMEKLACLIGRKNVQDKSWKPIHVSKGGAGISHLFLADGILLLSRQRIFK